MQAPFHRVENHLPRNPIDVRTHVRLELSRYLALFPTEIDAVAPVVDQIDNDPADVLNRSNMRGHVTTSAFVFDESSMKALLIHHRTYNRWLPPGGHYEDGHLWTSALREAVEETGVHNPQLHDWSVLESCPVDIDSHPIAARPAKGEQAHVHHDFAYLVSADSRMPLSAQLEEVLDARWVSLAVLEQLGDARLSRIVGKLENLGIARNYRII